MKIKLLVFILLGTLICKAEIKDSADSIAKGKYDRAIKAINSLKKTNTTDNSTINIQKLKIDQLEKIINLYKKILLCLSIFIISSIVLLFSIKRETPYKSLLFKMNKRNKNKVFKKRGINKIIYKQNIFQTSLINWAIVSESVIGKSHLVDNLPCQDSHFVNFITKDWGFAIVCDGAGSAKNSHIGAEFVAKEALPRYIKVLIDNEKWIEKNKLPSHEVWETKAKKLFHETLGALTIFANSNNIDISSLACTVIITIFSPIGLLVTHIGDGRAGMCDDQGKWHPTIIPHKGEEANQTIFLTSRAWESDKEYKMSGVNVPECNVFVTSPSAFVLMSDGCEQHSFECSVIDPDTNKWSDPNKPHEKFFNPLISTLKNMATSSTSIDMHEPWRAFLESGTEGLKNESDDKTMILGVLS
jgi:hypothetical protein